jgi:hypothetical protein
MAEACDSRRQQSHHPAATNELFGSLTEKRRCSSCLCHTCSSVLRPTVRSVSTRYFASKACSQGASEGSHSANFPCWRQSRYSCTRVREDCIFISALMADRLHFADERCRKEDTTAVGKFCMVAGHFVQGSFLSPVVKQGCRSSKNLQRPNGVISHQVAASQRRRCLAHVVVALADDVKSRCRNRVAGLWLLTMAGTPTSQFVEYMSRRHTCFHHESLLRCCYSRLHVPNKLHPSRCFKFKSRSVPRFLRAAVCTALHLLWAIHTVTATTFALQRRTSTTLLFCNPHARPETTNNHTPPTCPSRGFRSSSGASSRSSL